MPKIWGTPTQSIKGIDLNENGQISYLKEFQKYYQDLPFKATAGGKQRYFYENPAFSYGDAISLFSMIRMAKPGKIIEVGSGYSSFLMMDTNELFFDNQIKIKFIEPYPKLLLSRMNNGDKNRYEIIPRGVQYVNVTEFQNLKKGDILFIDSSHVSKTGSDVNYLMFEVLPALEEGVYIHFHDIFFPFEYPRDWVYEGLAWNEDYLLRAFLQYNQSFSIVYFNSFLAYFYKPEFADHMPLFLNNTGGSIWLKKLSR